MKKFIILFIIMALGVIRALAVETDNRPAPDATEYFSKASVLDSTLVLVAKPEFTTVGQTRKEEIVSTMLQLSGTRRAVVDSDGKSWLWYIYDNNLYCKSWNTNMNLIDDYNYLRVDRLGDDKWFFTVGGELSFISTTSVGINGRIGTYLWKRFLDAGLGINVGYSNGKGTDGWDVSANLSSRLYFTRFFSRIPLSPFIGVGLGFVFCPSIDFDPMGTVGFNWYLPKGSIDFAVQYGKASKFGITVDYTISF